MRTLRRFDGSLDLGIFGDQPVVVRYVATDGSPATKDDPGTATEISIVQILLWDMNITGEFFGRVGADDKNAFLDEIREAYEAIGEDSE